MNPERPVFFAANSQRWNRFLWIIRITGIVLVIMTIVVTIAVMNPEYVGLPRLLGENDVYKRLLNPDHPALARTKANAAFQRSRTNVPDKASFNYEHRSRTVPVAAPLRQSPVRAAFYVNWDLQSYYSLRDNIDRLSMVIPEWLFLPDAGDTVVASIENRALDLMREKKVPVVAMVSNFYPDQWNGANVHRILHSPEQRKSFIASILRTLQRYGFAGINVDFEGLSEESDEYLVQFMKELHAELHPAGYQVSIDVAPFNSDYNLARLNDVCDFIIVMAYDEHYAESVPGPVADQQWFRSVLSDITAKVPPRKIIVGLPAYGYDWPKNDSGATVSYYEALTTAKESDTTVTFDTTGYNLRCEYDDDEDVPHSIYFVDAATTFNQLQAITEEGAAGAALWRLGSEDPRMWTFYDERLSGKSPTWPSPGLEDIAPGSTDIDFEGEGEILNMVEIPEPGRVEVTVDSSTGLVTDEHYLQFPSSFVVKKYGKKDSVVALTFDDGPDARYTPRILDILNADGIKATFFVIGINVENNVSLLKRMYDMGEEIGNHSFTHPNLAEVPGERTAVELQATRRIIESITGHSTILFRPPYNADSEPESMEELLPVEIGKRENYYTVAESIDPQDWEPGVPADSILSRVIDQQQLGNIVLLHDAGGNREATVQALPAIIKYYRDKGYRFVTVSELMGKTRDEVMPPVVGRDQLLLTQFNWFVVVVIFWVGRFLFWFFLMGIVLSIGRTILTGVLAAVQQRSLRGQCAQPRPVALQTSVIVPAHNEEVNIVTTVRSLLAGTVRELEIIVVDDGSTDATAAHVREAFAGESRVQLIQKPNGGKASALNAGIAVASGTVVVCIDADTQLRPDAIERLLEAFDEEERVAAVAGNTKVGNEVNILTSWQAIEYITSQNFDRRAFDLLNAIAVVPGAIGAFRKRAVMDVGGFTPDTLAEDCDMTLKLLKAGWSIRYCPEAIALTEAPETVAGFLKQRFRWSFGIMQSVWKHRSSLFSKTTPNLGFVALPNILFFQIVLPLLSPLADLFMLFAIINGNAAEVIWYYLVFLLVDVVGAWIAFRFEGERASRLLYLLPQRFIYRQLMYWVLVKALLRAVQGELTQWGVLKRTGSVGSQQETIEVTR